jgi:hypothetical protein
VTETPTPAAVVSLVPAAGSSLAAVTTQTLPPVSQAPAPSTPVTTVAPVAAERTREPIAPPTVTVTPVAPVVKTLPADALAARHQPVVVRVKNDTLSYQPLLIDPWFYRMLVVGASENRDRALEAILPKTILQVESTNTRPTTEAFPPYSTYVWTDRVTLKAPEGATELPLNLRWVTDEQDVAHMFYQVSVYPFSTNATQWQNDNVAGLVGSGTVRMMVNGVRDTEGHQHAWIDFARVANHDPGAEPFYDGTVWRSHPSSVPGETLHPFNLGITGVELRTRSTNLGPVTVAMPVGLSMIDPSGPTEAQNANPNEGTTGFCTDCGMADRVGGAVSHLLGARDNTYYLRVVPIHKDGTAGRPSLPVTVTVAGPVECPAPSSVDATVRLPSVRIISYVPASETTENPITRWVMRQDSPPELISIVQMFPGVPQPPFYNLPKGYRFGWDAQAWAAANTPDKAWYEDVTDAVGDVFSFVFSPIIALGELAVEAWDYLVQLYETIKEEVVNLATDFMALAVNTLTLGLYDCSADPDCMEAVRSVANTGLNVALTACCIPPTLPTSEDLADMGTDYLIQLAADEMGVSAAYEMVPEEYRDDVREACQSGAGELIGQFQSKSGAAVDMGSFVMPDPLFSLPHPGTLNVRVYNPNSEPTDPVLMNLVDDGQWYFAEAVPVPSLGPGENVTIPIVLKENYQKFEGWGVMGKGGAEGDRPQNWAYWWWSNFLNTATDSSLEKVSFHVSFDRTTGDAENPVLFGLDETSQGQPIELHQKTYVIGENGCPGGATSSRVAFPPGWQLAMERKAYTANKYIYGEILEIVDPSTNSGYLRKE